MKSYFSILAFLCFFISITLTTLDVQSQTLSFSRTYKSQNYDDARSIAATDDGCYVLTGLDQSGEVDSGDMYLMKMNVAGAVLWKKYYGLPKEDGGNYLIKTNDGGFLISGHTEHPIVGEECDGYVVKTDKDGNTIWKRRVGTAFDDVCKGAIQSSDGSFYITGWIEHGDSKKFDAMLCKINPDGSIAFLKNLGYKYINEYGYNLLETPEQDIVIVGNRKDDTGYEKLFAVKCDKEGHPLWAYFSNEPLMNKYHVKAYDVALLSNGNYLLTGGMASGENLEGIENAFVAILSKEGELINFKKILGETENKTYAFDICQTGSDKIGLAGMIQNTSREQTYTQPLILLINEQLDVLDYKIIEQADDSRTVALINMENKTDFLFAGKCRQSEKNYDVLIGRETFDLTTTNINEVNNTPYVLFPNPMKAFTYINVETNETGNKEIILYNNTGQLVRKQTFAGTEFFLYKNNLASGIYFFQINGTENHVLLTGKLVVE